jgi:hypothetical protein
MKNKPSNQSHRTERKKGSIERIVQQMNGVKRYGPRAKGMALRITVLDKEGACSVGLASGQKEATEL